MKTFSLKAADVKHQWIIVDAASAPLGRIATVIASRLTGKYKPTYTPNIDDGDYVIVINADKAVLTGKKESQKAYYRHSGYPGGIKSRTAGETRQIASGQIIEHAVAGMVPRNKLHAERMKRLRVFPGADHPHAPQKPIELAVKDTNSATERSN